MMLWITGVIGRALVECCVVGERVLHVTVTGKIVPRRSPKVKRFHHSSYINARVLL